MTHAKTRKNGVRAAGLPLMGVSLAMVLALAGAAQGQTALGDGRALDRGLHSIDGRFNQARGGVNEQIRLNNAIITGTATNGRSFRGYVGYGSSAEFRGSTPSNDLYAFRRDSATSGLFGAGVRGTDALRYQFALTTGQAPPRGLAQSGIGLTSTGTLERSGTAASSGNASALRSTSEFLASQANRPALIGGRMDDQGYEWTAKSSPLAGIQWSRSAERVVRPLSARDRLAELDLGARPAQEDDQRSPTSIDDRDRTRPGLSGLESSVPGVGSALDRTIAGGGSSAMDIKSVQSTRGLSTRIDHATGQVHSELLRAMGAGSGPGSEPSRTGATAGTRAGAMPGAPAESGPEASTIFGQLERLRATLQGERDRPRPERTGMPGRVSVGAETVGPGGGRDPRDVVGAIDEQPTSTGIANLMGGGAGSAATGSAGALTPELVRGLRNVGSIKIEALAKPAAEPTAPRVDEAAYAVQMTAGQELYAKGQFFSAEDRYTRALSAKPGDPLASVGRVHAQLSAGLFLSAAANLRALVVAHPEMVPARYGENLIPSLERSESIAHRLRTEMARGSSALGRDSALLLAYLGHLRQDASWTTEGLVELAARSDLSIASESALVETLRAAWLK
jgi:hypothetical protein